MIKVCESEDEIRAIIIDDHEMLERSKNDYTNLNAEFLQRGIWLKWLSGDEIEALCFFKAESPFALDIHIHIPKKFRGAGTLQKGSDFLKWIMENNNGHFIKFNTKIPVIHRDVILFAMKLGFKREGTDRSSIIKNGVLMDMAIMGCTFKEAKCLV